MVKYKDRFGSSIRMRVLFNVRWTQTVNDSPASPLPSFPYSKQFSSWKPGMTREEQKVFGGLAAANCKIYYETFGACGGVSDNIWQLPPISLSAIQAPPPNCKVQAVNAEFLPRWCLQAPNLIEEKSRQGWWIRISGKKTSLELLWIPKYSKWKEMSCISMCCISNYWSGKKSCWDDDTLWTELTPAVVDTLTSRVTALSCNTKNAFSLRRLKSKGSTCFPKKVNVIY